MLKRDFTFLPYLKLVLASSALFLLSGCSEIAPKLNTNTGGNSGSTADFTKAVLVEEFTGVRCVNCPGGAQALKVIGAQYPERLIVVGIHSGTFSIPFSDSKYNFESPNSNELETLLGPPQGYPSAVLNRKVFDGETSRQLSRKSWDGYIAQEMALTSTIGIEIDNDYNTNTRLLKSSVKLSSKDLDESQDYRISVLLLESKLIDLQDTPSGKDKEYEHNHVLRRFITSTGGEVVTVDQLKSGATLEYETDLERDFKEKNMSVVVFINSIEANGEPKEVIQVREKDIQ